MPTCLICTVGGSHQPIVKAITSLQPDHVLFVCSETDSVSKNKGSSHLIVGKGNMLKSDYKLEKPDLPNIPTQCGWPEDRYQVLEVPSDDLDIDYQRINQAIDELNQKHNWHYIVDYTGGTKTMSASAVLCAVDRGLQLNLIVGTRANHIKVSDGSEQSMMLDIQHIRYQRQLKNLAGLWQSYAYQQAAQQAQKIPLTTQNRSSLTTFIEVSKAFAAWDRFDHAAAWRILEQYRARLMPFFGEQLKVLGHLSRTPKNEDDLKNTPWKLLDLWNNIQRKGAQGHYDDAIARLYRLLEWTAQWHIQQHKGYRTAELPRTEIPDTITLSQNSQGKYQAGLIASWQIAKWAGQADVVEFMQNHYTSMYDKIQKRNHSILAHGFTPIDQATYQDFNHWAQHNFLPLLQTLASKPPAKIALEPAQFQLPAKYPIALI